MYDYGYNDYGYTSSTYDSLGVLGSILQGYFIFFIILLLIVIAVGIVQTIGFWKIFKKAGKGGWEAIIPYYGNWVLVQIAGLNWWWFLLFFAPMVTSFIGLGWLGYLVNIFASFTCYYNICKKFNKGVGFAICFTLFTPICACILGFSKKEVYNASVPVSNNGLFGSTTNNSNNNVNNNYQNMQSVQPMQQQPFNQNIQPMQSNMNQTATPVQPMIQQPVVQPTMNEPVTNQAVTPVTPVMPEIQPQPVNPEPVSNMVGPKFCTKCGSQVDPNSRFCIKCGNQL